MSEINIVINTAKIPPAKGRAIGKAFYNAYMNFISNPENEKMIEQEAEEIKTKKKAATADKKGDF